MIKSAGIYRFKDGKTIVHSEKSVKNSGSYASEPYFFNEEVCYLGLARDLKSALEGSVFDAPEPTDWKILQKQHLDSMGLKSMKSLHDNSKYVSIYLKEELYVFRSSINKGPKQGFHYLKDKITLPLNSSMDDLADGLKRAFLACS